ncbi:MULTISPECIES: APC family permease [Lactobacillus]|uniref:Amino acid permease n=1 Tax=Lactobacillus xujianguonis TaxID=2495899 RepID=A0A437SUL3_9LACO|nr:MULTISPECIES: amino acid permease [Lactobacillus]RVU70621.1 amino acid permease [Lactobacillus xujianguonis]RVU73843.1 amino acid permease [Lactobacillus xujianguonis]
MEINLFRKPGIKSYLNEDIKFSKTLSAFDLIAMGVGAVIGTGIFILPGTVAALTAGPGVSFSFLIAACICVLAGMCYAEFASSIPVAGSAYSYGNIIYGEFIGWLMGWALILEYMLAVATVAAGWSSYFNSFIEPFGLKLPKSLSGPFDPQHGVYFDLVAVVVIVLIALLLARGIKSSIKINNLAVIIKIAIILIFIVVGLNFIKPANYHPFMPYHLSGVIKGATTVFFAFLGFDVVSASAAEVKKPQKNMQLGIISTLAVAVVLYMGVSIVLTGMVNYKDLNVANPVAFALQYVHQDWIAELLSLGAMVGMATMMLTMIYSSSRLIYAMARDGLLPHHFSKLDKKHNSPQIALFAVTVIIALGAAFFSVDQLTNLVSFGTLFAFTLVSFGILLLRKRTDIPNNGFKVPGYPVIPIISGLFCIFMMCQLNKDVYIMAGIWLLIGIVIYLSYGYRHSLIEKNNSTFGKD